MIERLKTEAFKSSPIDKGLLQKTRSLLSSTKKVTSLAVLLLLSGCIFDEEAKDLDKDDANKLKDDAPIASVSNDQAHQNGLIDNASKEQEEIIKYSFSSLNFEKFLNKSMPDYPLQKGRDIFDNNFKNYINLIFTQYPELLKSDGILMEEHFVNYLMWLQEKNLQPNTQSMRSFLDQLTNRKTTKKADKAYDKASKTSLGEQDSEHKKVNKADNKSSKISLNEQQPEYKKDEKVENKPSLLSRAKEYLQEKFGNNKSDAISKNHDKDDLSYHDQRTDDPEYVDQIERENNGDLFSIIRLQGQFFDKFTYNRLTKNYHTRAKAVDYEGREYLSISDLGLSLDSKSPNDIFNKVESTSFAEKLNSTTNFNSNSKEELIDSLVESHNLLNSNEVTKKNFDVRFNSDGTIATVYLDGKEYNPNQFITSPKKLKNIPGNQIDIEIGGISIKVDLGDYFKQYHKLEQQRQGTHQSVSVYDTENNQVTRFRNMMWFVEDDTNVYKKIAEEITKNVSSPIEKIQSLITWLQKNYDYIDEVSEINKITFGALMDHGGDCEDGFISLKTLAKSIGLDSYIAAVCFSNHIAPIVKGSHGDTTYDIDGETWTIAELATPKGKTVRLGETNKHNPWFFMMDQDTSISADGKHFPIKMVSTSELNRNLVNQLERTIAEAERFVNNLPQVNSDVLMKHIEKQVDSIKTAYQDIAKTSKMSDEINEKIKKISQKLGKLGTETLRKTQEADDNLKRKALEGQPEHIQSQANKFFELAEEINYENTTETLQKMKNTWEKYEGQEDNLNAMNQCRGELIDIINESKLYYNYSAMAKIYRETLRFLPEEKANLIKNFLENSGKLVQPCLDVYNKMGDIVDSLS